MTGPTSESASPISRLAFVTDEGRALNAAVGREVRRAIHEGGSNVRAVAERAGLSYRSVIRYMSGERPMPVPVLLALTNASRADLGELVRRLEEEIYPDLTPPPADASQHERQPPPRDGGVGIADGDSTVLRQAQLRLDQRLRALGVRSLAARSIGPIDADELTAIGDVVQEIVTELRPG